ncbi:hypothetical protein [Oryzihumus sp.]
MPEKATPARTGERRVAKRQATLEKQAAPEKQEHFRTLPVLVPEVHVRHVPLPEVHMSGVSVPGVHVSVPHALQPRLPEATTNRVLWFGGLAALAAMDVITWPVAGVVAAGSYIAERRARAGLAEKVASAPVPERLEPVPKPVAT